MALSPEEKRKRERERKARYRKAKRDAEQLATVTPIEAGRRSDRGTGEGTQRPGSPPVGEFTNQEAARAAIAELNVPASSQWRVAIVLTLARDLDSVENVPQRAGLTTRYVDAMEKLQAAVRSAAADPLDAQRQAFYRGRLVGDNEAEHGT